MPQFTDKSRVTWNVHLRSSPVKVFEFLSTDEGRRRWWASLSHEINDELDLGFGKFRVLERIPGELFRFEYFGGTSAAFRLTPTEDGGTDLNLLETGIPDEDHFLHNYPGWVEVLLVLKAAVDFGVDLRNKSPERTWDHDFVDV